MKGNYTEMYTQQEIDNMQSEFENSLAATLGITLLPCDGAEVMARMPVTQAISRPHRLLNGGASLALAETVAGYASRAVCGTDCVVKGMQVSGNHLSSAYVGDVLTATAHAIHCGRSTHVWDVEIRSEQTGKVISNVRVVNFIIHLSEA